MKAQRMFNIAELRAEKIDGSFVYHGNGMAFICPCGCKSESYLPKTLSDEERIPPSWEFSGTDDEPTLSPSVFNTGMPCRWHGWLTDGEWISL